MQRAGQFLFSCPVNTRAKSITRKIEPVTDKSILRLYQVTPPEKEIQRGFGIAAGDDDPIIGFDAFRWP